MEAEHEQLSWSPSAQADIKVTNDGILETLVALDNAQESMNTLSSALNELSNVESEERARWFASNSQWEIEETLDDLQVKIVQGGKDITRLNRRIDSLMRQHYMMKDLGTEQTPGNQGKRDTLPDYDLELLHARKEMSWRSFQIPKGRIKTAPTLPSLNWCEYAHS